MSLSLGPKSTLHVYENTFRKAFQMEDIAYTLMHSRNEEHALPNVYFYWLYNSLVCNVNNLLMSPQMITTWQV